MFKNLFKKNDEDKIKVPEIMGLRLGGAFELDELKTRLIEPNLIVEGMAKTHLIQAVGEIQLDEGSTLLRFYTDDEAFLEVLLTGGMTENHISDVKLWYFYETKSVGSDNDWNYILDNTVSQPHYKLEEHQFLRVWESVGGNSPPVAMTEKTYLEGNKTSTTDQFVMMYEREAGDNLFEYLTLAGEEKIIHERADRCLVTSTGFDILPADINIIG